MFQLKLILLSLIVPNVLAGSATRQLRKNYNRIDERNLPNSLHEHEVQSKLGQTEKIEYSKIVNNQRKLFSWAGAFKFVLHPPHPPHPHHQNGGGSGGGGSGSGGGSGGGGGGSSGSSSRSGGGSSGSGGGSSGGGSSSAAAWNDSERSGVNTGSRATTFATSASTITMFVIAACAAGAAIGAVVFGKKQEANAKAHPLHGGLNRRIALFSNFAKTPTSAVDRPERLVEMTTNGSEGDYVRA